MVKAKFALLEVKIKTVLLQAPKFYQASFCVCPETFYAINVRVFIGKFIGAMFNAEMFLAAEVDQAIISSPAIRLDDTFQADSPPDNALKSIF